MENWRQFFNGASLNVNNNRMNILDLPPRWWEKELKQPAQRRYPRLELHKQFIEGSKNQCSVGGNYAGTQCTSMCLEAIHYWATAGKQGSFDEKGEKLKVSTNADMRVSIEDLPDKMKFYYGMYFNQKNWETYVSMESEPGADGMDTLTNYLLGFADKPFGVLVTIGDYTQAVFYNKHHKWLVFDSHGHLNFLDHVTDNASCWEFSSVDEVVAFLMVIRGNKGYCLVSKPVIVPIVKAGSVTRINHFNASTACKSSSCPGNVKTVSREFDCDDDPFIGMMGGFGGS